MSYEKLEEAFGRCLDANDFTSAWKLSGRINELDAKVSRRKENSVSKGKLTPQPTPPDPAEYDLFWAVRNIESAIKEHPDKYGKYKAEYEALVADVEAFIRKYGGD